MADTKKTDTKAPDSQTTAVDSTITAGQVAPLLATPVPPGTGVNLDEDAVGLRTAEEKQKGIDAALKKIGGNEDSLTLKELAANQKTIARAISDLVELIRRSFNVDHIQQAPVEQVLTGEAAARASLSPGGESAHRVDDRVIPPQVNNPTDEILPPNVLPGSDEANKLGFAEVAG